MLCFYCNTEKTEDLFYRTTGKKFKCKQCHSDYIAKYIRERPEKVAANREYVRTARPIRRKQRKEFIRNLKREPCLDCGLKFHPEVMEFDHIGGGIKGGKQMAIAVLANTARSETVLLEEIAKCELVCANCHRIRTVIRRVGLAAYNKQLE